MALKGWNLQGSWRMAEGEEASMAAALGLVGIDRKGLEGQAAGMSHMIGAPPERALQPGIP